MIGLATCALLFNAQEAAFAIMNANYIHCKMFN